MCQKPLWALEQHKLRNMQRPWLSPPSGLSETVILPYNEIALYSRSPYRHRLTSVRGNASHHADLRPGSRGSRLVFTLHAHHLIPQSIQMLLNINMDLFTKRLSSADVSLSNVHLNKGRQAKHKWILCELPHQYSIVQGKVQTRFAGQIWSDILKQAMIRFICFACKQKRNLKRSRKISSINFKFN